MNSLCPLYFKSTFNHRLIAVLCLKSYTINYAIYTPNKAVSVYILVFAELI